MKAWQIREKIVSTVFFLAGSSSILILMGIFFMLFLNGIKAFDNISLSEFFLSADWNPGGYKDPSFGILAMIVSTFFVTPTPCSLRTRST